MNYLEFPYVQGLDSSPFKTIGLLSPLMAKAYTFRPLSPRELSVISFFPLSETEGLTFPCTGPWWLFFSGSVMSTLCYPMDCSTPGFPVLHHLLEFAETHVHQVGDAIQPSRLLSYPSPPASIFPRIRVFSNELALHIRWAKYTVKSLRL